MTTQLTNDERDFIELMRRSTEEGDVMHLILIIDRLDRAYDALRRGYYPGELPSIPAPAASAGGSGATFRYEGRYMKDVKVGDFEQWTPRDRRISKIELVNGIYHVWYDGQSGPMDFYEIEPHEHVDIRVAVAEPQPDTTTATDEAADEDEVFTYMIGVDGYRHLIGNSEAALCGYTSFSIFKAPQLRLPLCPRCEGKRSAIDYAKAIAPIVKEVTANQPPVADPAAGAKLPRVGPVELELLGYAKRMGYVDYGVSRGMTKGSRPLVRMEDKKLLRRDVLKDAWVITELGEQVLVAALQRR